MSVMYNKGIQPSIPSVRTHAHTNTRPTYVRNHRLRENDRNIWKLFWNYMWSSMHSWPHTRRKRLVSFTLVPFPYFCENSPRNSFVSRLKGPQSKTGALAKRRVQPCREWKPSPSVYIQFLSWMIFPGSYRTLISYFQEQIFCTIT